MSIRIHQVRNEHYNSKDLGFSCNLSDEGVSMRADVEMDLVDAIGIAWSLFEATGFDTKVLELIEDKLLEPPIEIDEDWQKEMETIDIAYEEYLDKEI